MLQDQDEVNTVGVSSTYDICTFGLLKKASERRVQIVHNRWYEGNR